jgi:hypothetical protein
VKVLGRLVAASVALVLGVTAGVAAVVVHTEAWGWPLGVAAAVATARALPPTWWARLPFCWAWGGTVLWLSASRPEGDYLVSSDLPGYGLLVVAVVLAVLGSVGAIRGRARSLPGPAVSPP